IICQQIVLAVSRQDDMPLLTVQSFGSKIQCIAVDDLPAMRMNQFGLCPPIRAAYPPQSEPSLAHENVNFRKDRLPKILLDKLDLQLDSKRTVQKPARTPHHLQLATLRVDFNNVRLEIAANRIHALESNRSFADHLHCVPA